MAWIKVFAPATIGNIGPGFDVLGMAVKGLGDVVEARKRNSGVVISAIHSPHPLSLDPQKNTAGIAAMATLKRLGVSGGVELVIRKGMPSGSGLGSSAASACAAAFAVNALYNNRLSREELIEPATIAEEYVSGGFFADNTAPCLLGGVTLTRSNLPLDVTKIGTINALYIVLVTPALVVLTKEARAVLPQTVPLKNFITNMANAALITAAFARGDYNLFARSLHDVIIEPARAPLIKGFLEVKAAALNAGADGMTISGSGPTVFAITNVMEKAKRIATAMTDAFAAHDIKAEARVTEVDAIGTKLI